MNDTLNNPQDARENELFALQKEYRIMEHNRRQYAEESQVLLRKQQSTIDKLRRDNEDLKNEIALSMRSTNKTFSATQQEALGKLHDSGDKYANAIDYERRNIATMEEQIQIMKQKVRIESCVVLFGVYLYLKCVLLLLLSYRYKIALSLSI